MAHLPELTESEFEAKVLQSATPVLLDFSAEWCGPCKLLAPTIEALAKEYAGKVSAYQVDIDHSPNLASQYGVMAVPTILLFKGGEVAEQLVGANPKKTYVSKIEALLK